MEMNNINEASIPVEIMNNILKWTFFISGMSGLMLLSGVFAAWLLIEALVVLIDITA
jgi:hypothetical protein